MRTAAAWAAVCVTSTCANVHAAHTAPETVPPSCIETMKMNENK